MSKLSARSTISGATLSGASLKTFLLALWDAVNSQGFSDVSRAAITGSTTLTNSQSGLVLVDATSASVVLTLPTSGSGTDDVLFMIRRIDTSTANSVTVQRGGSDTIEGSSSALLIPPGGMTEVQMPGGATNWRVVTISGGTAAGARANLSASESPFRNVLINGDMFVDQRNATASQTFTAAAALAYCVDRWYGYATGANVTGQRIQNADNTTRYRFTGAASVTGIGFAQRVEANNTLHLAGNVCTLSAKLSNSLLTSVGWALYYANTVNTFGSLAAPTRTLISSGTFTVNSTEAVYSAQINVPSAAITGLELVLTVGAQTSGTWTIGEVQLERGAIPAGAISFERIETGENLRRTQRYYVKTFSQDTKPAQNIGSVNGAIAFIAQSTNSHDIMWQFPVEMRVAPATVTTYSPNAASANWSTNTDAPVASAVSAGSRQVTLRAATPGAAGRSYQIHATAEAEL